MDRAHEPLGPLLTERPRRRARDRELEAGSLAHYEDPAYYAEAYASRVDDVAYYVALARERGAVLEYGVGNGRIAIPSGRAGARVVGVDHARPMLADLRARLRREPVEVRRRVTARAGDMRRVRLGRRFPLVTCPFNGAQHLYTRADVEGWLARVREHLEPRGELVFDVTMPVPSDLARDPAHAYRAPPLVHPRAGRVRYREHFDYDAVRQILFVSMWFEPTRRGATGAEDFMTPLAHRQFFPCELEALLHYNGFEVTALRGDFAGAPLAQTSDVIVVHARRRGR